MSPLARQLGLLAVFAFVMGPVRAQAAPVDREAEYMQARADFLDLLQDGKRNRFRHHWNPLIGRLSRSADALPKGQRKCEATFNLGRAWQEISAVSYLQDDRDQGAKAFRLLADRCPDSSLADDGLFHAADLTARADPQGA
ncbi:MAG TPA: hypothetical protein VGD74_01280, partial [Vulgatibacter sp.]